MKIVVIGAGGFLGKNLIIKLLQHGYDVVAVDRAEVGIKHPKLTSFVTNVDESISVNKFVNEGDTIVYLLTSSVPINSNTDVYNDAKSNVLLAIRIFEKCIEAGAKKILFASSGGTVYGKPHYLPIDEKHSLNPNSAYAISKLAIEKYLLLLCSLNNIMGINLRISNPYGPGQRPFVGQGVIATFLASSLLNRTIEIWGAGDNIRDYIYIDDVSYAFIKAVEYNGQYNTFNIGSGEGHDLLEIISVIKKHTGKELEIKYMKESNIEIKSNILDNSLAKKELDWNPQVDLTHGIGMMLDNWNDELNLFIIKTDKTSI